MARPKVIVQHFLACQSVSWEGRPGPKTARTLEGVIHRFGVSMHAEPGFTFEEVWLYARLYRTNAAEGYRRFRVRLVWTDAPEGPREIFTRPVGRVRFSNAEPIANAAWPFRPVVFPGLGRYEFQLLQDTRTYLGPQERVVAHEFILIERQP